MTAPTPPPQVPSNPHSPPDGTVLGLTYLGQEVYLLPCDTCGAAIPELRRDWQTGNAGPHVRRHNARHTQEFRG